MFIYIQFVFIDAYVCLNGGEINDSNVTRNRRDILGLLCNVLIPSMMWSSMVLFEIGLGLVVNVNCKPLKTVESEV